MLTTIFIVCALIWLPLLFHQLSQRGFLILLIWFCIAPVGTNLINGLPNPLFPLPLTDEERVANEAKTSGPEAYRRGISVVTLREILEPTRVLMGSFLAVFFLNALLKKKRLIPLDSTEIWMSLFSLILIAGVFLHSNRLPFALRIAVDAFIVPFIGYYVTRRLVTSETRFHQFVQVLGYIGFYVIICSLIERIVHKEIMHRLSGPFAGGTLLHMVLSVAFFATVSLVSGHNSDPPNAKPLLPSGIIWVVLYLTPFMIFLTLSRGNWVGLLMAIMVFLLLRNHIINFPRRLLTVGFILILVPMIFVMSLTALTAVPQAIESRAVDMGSVNWRLIRWQVAIKEGITNPVFGIGLNALLDTFGRVDGNHTSAHNSFITIFAEQGLLGLLAYLAIVISIIRVGWELYRKGTHAQDRWWGIALISIFIAYLVPGVFSNTIHSGSLGQIYVYVFAGATAGLYSQTPLTSKPSKFSRSSHISFGSCVTSVH